MGLQGYHEELNFSIDPGGTYSFALPKVQPPARIEGAGLFTQERRDFMERQLLVRGDGTKFPGEISSGIFKDTNGRLGTSMSIPDITQQKQVNQELQSLASKLLLAEERERREIAVELHDNMGQTLAASKIKLEVLISKSDARFEKPLNEIRELIDQAIQYTRSLTFDLSPLYDIGLEAAIEWLAEKTQKEHGLLVDVQSHPSPRSIDHEIRILLFQIVRELLFNVVKHAKARHAWISVRGDSGQIRIHVKDDGVGFDTSEVQLLPGGEGGFGLFSIQERLSYFGGNLQIVSKLHIGTEVTITAPSRLRSQSSGETFEPKSYSGR